VFTARYGLGLKHCKLIFVFEVLIRSNSAKYLAEQRNGMNMEGSCKPNLRYHSREAEENCYKFGVRA
jgi:hypothetical protein